MKQGNAEVIGLTALTWLIGNDELLPVFMGATGAGVDDLKAGANSPEFLGSLLDFLMMNDAWVVDFCDANGLDYEQPMRARQALPGGMDTSWTRPKFAKKGKEL